MERRHAPVLGLAVAAHAQFACHVLRRRVLAVHDSDNLLQLERLKAILQARERRLGGQSLPPVGPAQQVADLYLLGLGQVLQADPAGKLARGAQVNRP